MFINLLDIDRVLVLMKLKVLEFIEVILFICLFYVKCKESIFYGLRMGCFLLWFGSKFYCELNFFREDNDNFGIFFYGL